MRVDLQPAIRAIPTFNVLPRYLLFRWSAQAEAGSDSDRKDVTIAPALSGGAFDLQPPNRVAIEHAA
jgi:hypothetical protein